MVKKKDDAREVNTMINGEFETTVNDLLEESLFLPDAALYEEDNSKSIEAMKKYKEYMEKKVIFKVNIVRTDNKGNLFVPLSGNLQGCILNAEVYGETYDAKKRNLHVGATYAVIAVEIDEDKGIVYLSRHKAKLAARDVLKTRLKAGMKVKARVEFYQEKNKRVYINIEGCGILGYVHISEWAHKFIEEKDIEDEVKPGEVIKVEILSYKPQKGKIKEAFECSRKNCINNPWIGIEEKLKKNDIIEITATQLHEDHFYGPLPDMELDIYVEYPCRNNSVEDELKEAKDHSEEQKIKARPIIKKGHRYQVRVYKVDEAKKVLRARVVKEIIRER